MSIKRSLVAILTLISFAGCAKESYTVKKFEGETVELRTMSSYDSPTGKGYTIIIVTKPSGFKTAYKDIEDNDLILDRVEEIDEIDENNNKYFYSRDDDLSQFQEEFDEYLKKFKQN